MRGTMSEEGMLVVRRSTIDDITSFIETSCKQLDELLHRLQWSKEEILDDGNKKMKTCPINSNHLVPETSLECHIHACQLMAKGYSRREQKEISESHSFYYAESTSVVPVVIGTVANKEVPLTVDRMDKTLTPAEKLALHDAVLEKARASKKEGSIVLKDLEFDPEAVLKKEGTDKPKSRLEILAQLRDYKRRRQSYRAKNVHITRRSQTEIMREVIEAQMTEIQQALQSYNADHRGSPSSQDRPRSRDVSRSPVSSCSRQDDYSHERRREHTRSERSGYEDETDHRSRGIGSNSRDTSPRHHSSRSQKYPKDSDFTKIKNEKDDASRSRESSRSPKRSRPAIPRDHDMTHIKDEEGGHNSSRTRRDERTGEGSRHHSKHKHKHRHHSRDNV